MQWHPETLSAVLPLVLQGITNTELGTAATIALKDITRENLSNIQPFAHQILVACQVLVTLIHLSFLVLDISKY